MLNCLEDKDMVVHENSVVFPDGSRWEASSLVIHCILERNDRWQAVEHIIEKDELSWSVYKSAILKQ